MTRCCIPSLPPLLLSLPLSLIPIPSLFSSVTKMRSLELVEHSVFLESVGGWDRKGVRVSLPLAQKCCSPTSTWSWHHQQVNMEGQALHA